MENPKFALKAQFLNHATMKDNGRIKGKGLIYGIQLVDSIKVVLYNRCYKCVYSAADNVLDSHMKASKQIHRFIYFLFSFFFGLALASLFRILCTVLYRGGGVERRLAYDCILSLSKRSWLSPSITYPLPSLVL